MHTYIHIYIYTSIHTYIHTSIHAYIDTLMHTYVHTNASGIADVIIQISDKIDNLLYENNKSNFRMEQTE